MNKNIFAPLSIASIIGGYFLNQYLMNINPLYATISLIFTVVVAFGLFYLSPQGKKFINFFNGVKQESKKIFYPNLSEVMNGFGVVLIFCTTFLVLIWLMDSVFMKLYQLTM